MCLVDGFVLFDGSKGGVYIFLSIFVRLDADLMYDLTDFSTSILLIRLVQLSLTLLYGPAISMSQFDPLIHFLNSQVDVCHSVYCWMTFVRCI